MSDEPLPLWGVWEGSGVDDVFAVGNAGVIVHFDGTSWNVMPAETQDVLRGVWGTAPDNVYAAGDFGTVLHFDGVDWSTAPNLNRAFFYQAVGGFSENEIYLVGEDLGFGRSGAESQARFPDGRIENRHGAGMMVFHDGKDLWEPVYRLLQQDLIGFGGTPDDAFATGALGFMMRFDGTDWTQERFPTDNWLRSVWRGRDGTTYVVGDGGAILRFGRGRLAR
ncbi:MAG: hypothetical protein R3E12_19810 [Candidatus Eisenbacteria bacterium]